MLRRKKTDPPLGPVAYPAGTFIKTEKGYFYIAGANKRYRITSVRVLNSWSPPRVVDTTEAAVAGFRVVAKMKFRNGSLIWNLSDAKLYLIENGKRRWLKNPAWFDWLGVEYTKHAIFPKNAICVSADEIALHELGEDLN